MDSTDIRRYKILQCEVTCSGVGHIVGHMPQTTATCSGS